MRLSAKSGHQRRFACGFCLQRADTTGGLPVGFVCKERTPQAVCLWVLSAKSGHQSGLPVGFVRKERTSKAACQ